MRTCLNKEFFIIDWKDAPKYQLYHFIRDFPEIVIGQHLAVVAVDSGRFVLMKEDLAAGWRQFGELAISPKIQILDGLPLQGFDEWYIFSDPREVSKIEAFVNYSNFSPIDYDQKEILDSFWSQAYKSRALHILGEGDVLYFVTRDKLLFERISKAPKGPPSTGSQPKD